MSRFFASTIFRSSENGLIFLVSKVTVSNVKLLSAKSSLLTPV